MARARVQGQKYSSASVSNMRIKQGQYTFTKLYTWRKKAADKLLAMDGVYSIDIDESNNKLSVGVKNKDVKDKVVNKFAELNIPVDAVAIDQMSPPVLLTTLEDEVATFSGGIQISYGVDLSCTMGPTVRWRESASGTFQTGYITASHCTPPVGGGVNGTIFRQPDFPVLDGNFAGTEIRDPLFTSNRCWDTGQNCRESDAALINYSDSDPDILPGSIYKTTSRGRDNGSIDIPGTDQFHIKGVNDFIPEGTQNNKVGAITGWTYGPVTDICRDFTVGGTTVVCQNVVQAGADNGDSGSPVFETTSHPDSVIFDGVLSGGYSQNGDPYFWYSSVTRIKNELSGPDVHDLTFTSPPPPLSVSIGGPNVITTGGSYTWEANAKRGDGSYSYQWEYASSLGGPWTTVGSNKTYSRFVTKTNQLQRFYLQVTVTSGAEEASTTHNVTVTSNDCPPDQICPKKNQTGSN